MDSSDVAKALTHEVFPILREAGFAEFTTRTAWRLREHVIDVAEFPSLGSYLGGAIGVTSHSFVATVGVYYEALHATPWSTQSLPQRPKLAECQARRALRKSCFQLWCRRPDVWFVTRRGSNLRKMIADVRRAIEEQALPWLSALGDPARALDAFESRGESEMRRGIMLESFGGRLNSFARAEAASALALASGQRERARRAWQRVLDNPYYQSIPDMRRKAEERLAQI